MEKTKILITGGNGLVGSRIVELLSDKYTFSFINRTSGVDITDKEAVLSSISSSDASIVLHLAAKADVEGCEKDKELKTDGEAWKINVEGTRNVVDACIASNKKIIYISTDFVFGGDDTPEKGYTEESHPNPVNWYAQTKYEGEKIVQGATVPWVIMRIAYPYRAKFVKNDFVRVFKSLLEQGKHLNLITDHIVNATFIDDIAGALDVLLDQNQTGIYHVTGNQALSPYEEGLLVAKTFGLNDSLIGKTTRAEFFKDRAKRPFNLHMNNDRIIKLGIKMKTFEEGLAEIKNQI
jgi:dTDP-4-dehydrorhamnose reductase